MENMTKQAQNINMTYFIILIIAGFVLASIFLILRVRTSGKYEIRSNDIIFALLPVILWLLGTGKIVSLNIPGVGKIDMASIFTEAAQTPVNYTITPVTFTAGVISDIEITRRERKSSPERIPELIKKKTEALEFQLGLGGYAGPAIEKYLGEIGFLKYVIIYDRGGKLIGVYDFQKLFLHLQNLGEKGYELFALNLNRGDHPSQRALQDLPGFVSVSDALTTESSRRLALETMERINSNILPVVDKNQRFIGIADRDKITASLIIDVTKEMEKLSNTRDKK